MAVVKVRNLEEVSRKAAKMAKDLGLDQLSPEFGDPLGSLEEKAQISKGVNRAGDLAIVVFDPAAVGGDNDKAVLILVPVSDYKAFLGNFKDAKTAGDVTSAKTADGEDIYVAERGKYAALCPGKDLLAKKANGGLKLEGLAAKEADTKDAILYANMKTLRAKLLPELKENRQKIIDQFQKGLEASGNDALKPYEPVLRTVIEMYLNVAQQFLDDARAATVGLSLSDEGITGTVLADFDPGSYIGKLAAQTKNTDAPLLAGLPGGADRQYFLFGGSLGDPKVSSQLIHDLIDPVKTELAKVASAKQFVPALDAWEKAAGVTTGMSIGWVAPKGVLGGESLVQEVAVIRGTDAKTIHEAQRQVLQATGDLLKAMPQQKEAKAAFDFQKDAKTTGGVAFDTFETKFDPAEDNAQGQQMKQVMNLIYGPNGQTGMLGQVNDKTVLLLQGAPEQLVTDAITAAKANSDDLSNLPGVKAVAAQLPKNRCAAVYIDLGAMVNTGIRDAKALNADIKVKLPANLPPIGVTAGTEETAYRVDGFIPKTLVQAMISAGAQVQQQAGNRGGGL